MKQSYIHAYQIPDGVVNEWFIQPDFGAGSVGSIPIQCRCECESLHLIHDSADVEIKMGTSSLKAPQVALSHVLHRLSFPGVVYFNVVSVSKHS